MIKAVPQRHRPVQGTKVRPVSAFWRESGRAQMLWRACLDGGATVPDHAIGRLCRLGALIELPAGTADCPRWANFAWCNGTRAAQEGISQETILALTGASETMAASLVAAALAVRGVVATGKHPLHEQREVLARVLTQSGAGAFVTRTELVRDCVLAGWLAFHRDSLLSVRAVLDTTLNSLERIATRWVVAETKGVEEALRREALVQFVAPTYTFSTRERDAIAHAMTEGLRQARREGWDLPEFLRDAFRRGERLACDDSATTWAMIGELGRDTVEQTHHKVEGLLGRPIPECTAPDALAAVPRFLRRLHPNLISTHNQDAPRVLMLRQAYDFLFWVGLWRRHSRGRA